ncbi:SDR family oxidoreductase [Streptomyces sp. NEAU-W12]|uniref:SDR family oxidoreductase n=1 Tax=Streptomyces sp. NEAU-W12 TaxID=2994668 RepID=UPI002B05F3B3|nr:SDR family oxidoreductase [Streptomyces sp. NEAU-W12]
MGARDGLGERGRAVPGPAPMHRGQGIRANAFVPGGTIAGVPAGLETGREAHGPAVVGRYMVDMGRLSEAEEQAAAIVFLASGAASSIIGVVLPVDNGWPAVCLRRSWVGPPGPGPSVGAATPAVVCGRTARLVRCGRDDLPPSAHPSADAAPGGRGRPGRGRRRAFDRVGRGGERTRVPAGGPVHLVAAGGLPGGAAVASAPSGARRRRDRSGLRGLGPPRAHRGTAQPAGDRGAVHRRRAR